MGSRPRLMMGFRVECGVSDLGTQHQIHFGYDSSSWFMFFGNGMSFMSTV